MITRRTAMVTLASLPATQLTAFAQPVVNIPPLLGYGINSVGYAVKALPFVGRTGTREDRISDLITLEYVSDYSSLYRSLDVSAQASFSGFAGHASASLSIAQSAQWDDYSSYLVLKRYITTQDVVLDQPSLDNATSTRYALDPDWFLDQYGDQYVSKVIFGGALYLMIKITASTRKSAESLRASASGSYGTVSGSAQVNQVINSFSQHGSISFNAQQIGTSATQSPPIQQPATDNSQYIDQIFSYIQTFKANLYQSIGTEIDFETKPYSTAGGAPRFSKDFSSQKQWFIDADRNRDAIESRKLILEYADENPSLFKPDIPVFSDKITSLNHTLTDLSDYVTRLFNRPANVSSGPPGNEASLPASPQPLPVPPIPINVTIDGRNGGHAQGGGGQMVEIPVMDPFKSLSVQLFSPGRDVSVWFHYTQFWYTIPPTPHGVFDTEGVMSVLPSVGSFSIYLKGADAGTYTIRYKARKAVFPSRTTIDTAYFMDGDIISINVGQEELRGIEVSILPRV